MRDNLPLAKYGNYEVYVRDTKQGDHFIASDVIANDTYALKKIFEFYPDLAGEKMTILDIGGHIGCFGLMILDLMPEAKLVAFEPLKEAYELYEMNVRKYIDQGRAFVYNRAVSYSSETLTIIFSADPTVHSGNVMAVSSAPAENGISLSEQSTRTITLEKALAETGFEADSYLMKIDCEAGEWDILPNISKYLSSRIKMVLGEWHHHDYQHILRVMEEYFPHLYTSTHRGWGCGNFWSVEKDDENHYHYCADHISLRYLNDFAQYHISLLRNELDQVKAGFAFAAPPHTQGELTFVQRLRQCAKLLLRR